MSDERQQSWNTANRWLDHRMNSLVEMVPGDPDCDACALARCYLRALEKIERMQELLLGVAAGPMARIETELDDEWPKAVQ